MPLPASIEAADYSRWDDDDLADPGDTAVFAGDLESRLPSALPAVAIDAGAEADGGRLDKWLAARLPAHSRSRIQRWIADGHVRIGERIAATRDPVWRGDRVHVAPQPSDDANAFVAEPVPLSIVFEDDALIVVDKPAGLVVHPAVGNWRGTLLNGLLHHAPSLAGVPRAGIVHRLDKDTSGLMVVTKTVEAQTDLVRQLQARTVGRTYVALVHGTPPVSGRIVWPIGRDPRDRLKMAAFRPPDGARVETDARPGAKPAATRFATLARVAVGSATVSLVVCRLETGRTHQIRVHLQALGHPLVGDATYGAARAAVPFGRQALHAWRLRLVHPVTRVAVAWHAALPDDFATLARDLALDVPALLATIEASDADD